MMSILTNIETLYVAPEFMMSFVGLVFLVLGAYLGDRSTRLLSWLSIIAFVMVGFYLSGINLNSKFFAFNRFFVLDDFAIFLKLLILIGASFSLFLSINFNRHEKVDRFELPVLYIFSTIGMMMMVSANDFMTLYLAVELQSLCLYILAASRRDSILSSEAGLKYFVLGALSSGLLLYGISLVYGFTVTTNFSDLMYYFEQVSFMNKGAIVGLIFILSGLAFKISAVPFHMWTPDVYQGSTTPVTAFFSIAPKVAAMGLFVRVLMEPFGNLFIQWQQVLIFVSAITMIVGALGALRQQNLKRLLAYSSIGHVGFLLLGLSAGSQEGVRSVLIYLLIYIFMNVGVFTVMLSVRKNKQYVETLSDFSGLAKTHPFLAFMMVLFMFSMAGIPPLAGFFAKFYVLMAAIESELYILAIVGVLTSVVSAFYYLNVIKVIYFDEPISMSDQIVYDAEIKPILVISGSFITFFFLYPMPLIQWASKAAQSIFN